eukprot:6213147-Pleurochrysis_carterae.AAC.2
MRCCDLKLGRREVERLRCACVREPRTRRRCPRAGSRRWSASAQPKRVRARLGDETRQGRVNHLGASELLLPLLAHATMRMQGGVDAAEDAANAVYSLHGSKFNAAGAGPRQATPRLRVRATQVQQRSSGDAPSKGIAMRQQPDSLRDASAADRSRQCLAAAASHLAAHGLRTQRAREREDLLACQRREHLHGARKERRIQRLQGKVHASHGGDCAHGDGNCVEVALKLYGRVRSGAKTLWVTVAKLQIITSRRQGKKSIMWQVLDWVKKGIRCRKPKDPDRNNAKKLRPKAKYVLPKTKTSRNRTRAPPQVFQK